MTFTFFFLQMLAICEVRISKMKVMPRHFQIKVLHIQMKDRSLSPHFYQLMKL